MRVDFLIDDDGSKSCTGGDQKSERRMGVLANLRLWASHGGDSDGVTVPLIWQFYDLMTHSSSVRILVVIDLGAHTIEVEVLDAGANSACSSYHANSSFYFRGSDFLGEADLVNEFCLGRTWSGLCDCQWAARIRIGFVLIHWIFQVVRPLFIQLNTGHNLCPIEEHLTFYLYSILTTSTKINSPHSNPKTTNFGRQRPSESVILRVFRQVASSITGSLRVLLLI